MKTDGDLICKQPDVFLVNKKQKVPESNNFTYTQKSTKINICLSENASLKPNIHFSNEKENNSYIQNCLTKESGKIYRRTIKSNILYIPQETFKYSSFLKVLAVLLLICDIFYLHINLQSVEVLLQNSLKNVENLEEQLKFSRLNSESFKADVNYLMYLNRMLTKDINSKIELLIKLNKLFIDHADSSLNFIIDTIRNRKNDDDDIIRIVKKRSTSNGLTQYNEISQTLLSDRNHGHYLEDSFGNSDQDAENELNALPNKDDVQSLIGNLNYEKNEMNFRTGLQNITFDGFNTSSEGYRVKRQTTNNSRSNNRGKHHNGKLKNRGHHRHVNCNLFCCSAGPLLAHFRGAQPEALIQDGGIIAPWFGDLDISGDYLNRNILLKEGKAKLEVSEKGLYLIYAQVYYLTSNPLNSFSINIQGEKEETGKVVALCSTEAALKGMSEVSCYTSIVRQLQPGDKVFLMQRERYRRVLFREGHTFLGVVALNNPPKC
ncbi:uncharacterized protein LOC142329094 isoform X2 [Lycorma delicatula]|uniref:uncharacterized protein LOC142329094 isoform X2 n=1 Tax=Lycorma delicatula TaxID=130591 RepID=UPI003F510F32